LTKNTILHVQFRVGKTDYLTESLKALTGTVCQYHIHCIWDFVKRVQLTKNTILHVQLNFSVTHYLTESLKAQELYASTIYVVFRILSKLEKSCWGKRTRKCVVQESLLIATVINTCWL
jgi:hypothetical protein